MSAESNGNWQFRTQTLLKDGYGVEDIALKTGTDVSLVRLEVAILRQSGELEKMFGGAQ